MTREEVERYFTPEIRRELATMSDAERELFWKQLMENLPRETEREVLRRKQAILQQVVTPLPDEQREPLPFRAAENRISAAGCFGSSHRIVEVV
jgi:hypothetical protein